DTSGSIQERYTFNPFGAFQILTPSWSSRASSLYGWTYFDQGTRYDVQDGVSDFRFREYSAALGRWLEPDPLRYAAGDTNLYRSDLNAPTEMGDPTGLKVQLEDHHWFPQFGKYP